MRIFRKSVALSALAAAGCFAAIVLAGKPRGDDGPQGEGWAKFAPAARAPITQRKGEAVDPRALMRGALAEKLRDRGTSIAPKYDAPDEVKGEQQKICDMFNARPSAPSAVRLDYFRWFTENDYRINGWYGAIQEVTADGDRALVKIRIAPHLSSMRATITSTTDYYFETYELKGGTFRFLMGEEPVNVLRMVMGD